MRGFLEAAPRIEVSLVERDLGRGAGGGRRAAGRLRPGGEPAAAPELVLVELFHDAVDVVRRRLAPAAAGGRRARARRPADATRALARGPADLRRARRAVRRSSSTAWRPRASCPRACSRAATSSWSRAWRSRASAWRSSRGASPPTGSRAGSSACTRSCPSSPTSSASSTGPTCTGRARRCALKDALVAHGRRARRAPTTARRSRLGNARRDHVPLRRAPTGSTACRSPARRSRPCSAARPGARGRVRRAGVRSDGRRRGQRARRPRRRRHGGVLQPRRPRPRPRRARSTIAPTLGVSALAAQGKTLAARRSLRRVARVRRHRPLRRRAQGSHPHRLRRRTSRPTGALHLIAHPSDARSSPTTTTAPSASCCVPALAVRILDGLAARRRLQRARRRERARHGDHRARRARPSRGSTSTAATAVAVQRRRALRSAPGRAPRVRLPPALRGARGGRHAAPRSPASRSRSRWRRTARSSIRPRSSRRRASTSARRGDVELDASYAAWSAYDGPWVAVHATLPGVDVALRAADARRARRGEPARRRRRYRFDVGARSELVLRAARRLRALDADERPAGRDEPRRRRQDPRRPRRDASRCTACSRRRCASALGASVQVRPPVRRRTSACARRRRARADTVAGPDATHPSQGITNPGYPRLSGRRRVLVDVARDRGGAVKRAAALARASRSRSLPSPAAGARRTRRHAASASGRAAPGWRAPGSRPDDAGAAARENAALAAEPGPARAHRLRLRRARAHVRRAGRRRRPRLGRRPRRAVRRARRPRVDVGLRARRSTCRTRTSPASPSGPATEPQFVLYEAPLQRTTLRPRGGRPPRAGRRSAAASRSGSRSAAAGRSSTSARTRTARTPTAPSTSRCPIASRRSSARASISGASAVGASFRGPDGARPRARQRGRDRAHRQPAQRHHRR